MGSFDGVSVFERLGVRASINAVGTGTLVGGSGPPEIVREKMEEASQGFTDMGELLARSGEFVAGLVGTEAAFVTSGGAAALALSAAAWIAGADPDRLSRLPDTTGLKNEILVQKKRFGIYDRILASSGAKLVEIGTDVACTPEQLEDAIGPKTAAIYYPWPPYGAHPPGLYDLAPPPGDPDLVSIDNAREIGAKHGVPLIADGASEIYPLDYFRKVAQAGDLVSFGGKYYGGPNASGFVCGRKDLIDAVAASSWIPTTSGMGIGRTMKSDRQQIVGLVVALDMWFTLNHEDRIEEYDRRITMIEKATRGLVGVSSEVYWSGDSFYGSFLTINLDNVVLGKDAQQVKTEMFEGDPSIMLQAPDDETLRIFVYTLNDGEAEKVASRLDQVLSSKLSTDRAGSGHAFRAART